MESGPAAATIQLKIWIGNTVNGSPGAVRRKAMNVNAPIGISGAASPMARDSARIVPVRMPGKALGSTWSPHGLPAGRAQARPAWRMELGTARSASREAMITMTAGSAGESVRPPARGSADLRQRFHPNARTEEASPRMP